MFTTPVTTSTASSNSSTSSAIPTQTLDQNDFMKLLMAQLQNQDPTQPVDDTQFASELAQFSSLQQLTDIGTTLDTMLTAQSSTNQLQTAGMVGMDVLFNTSQVSFDGKDPVSLGVSQSIASDSTVATVTNSSGALVRTVPLGAEPAGVSSFTWDGNDSNGNPVAAGTYNVTVTATRTDSQSVTASVLSGGQVSAVNFNSSGSSAPTLVVAGQQVQLSNVVQVVNP